MRRLGYPRWDRRNVVSLCRRCHKGLHHNRLDPLPYSVLTPANLEFAKEVLGPAWDDWLRRRYGDE